MRTTIRIEDDLYREVKERAARTGRTVAAVIEDAVRVAVRPPAGSIRPPYHVEPWGAGGLLPGVDLASNASIMEALDEGTPVDAMR